VAFPETLVAEAARLLEIATRCPTPDLGEPMRELAREFIERAHREAEVCCYPAPRIAPPGEGQRDGESAGEVAGRSAEPVNSANVRYLQDLSQPRPRTGGASSDGVGGHGAGLARGNVG